MHASPEEETGSGVQNFLLPTSYMIKKGALSMPNTDLPEEITEPAESLSDDEPKLDRRTAIAQARAIRREAAAMDEAVKAQAAETANIILENAEPGPPKVPLHKQTEPVPVTNATGKFSWLDDVKKPETPRADADALIAELLAEAEARAEKPADADAEIEKIVAETAPADDADALVAQVLAETAPPEPADEPEIIPPAAEITEENDSAEEAAAETETAAESENAPEQTAADENAEALEEAAETAPAEPVSEAEEDAPAPPPKKPPAPRPVPPRTVANSREAAADYRKKNAEAKSQVRKLAKRSERAWRKEAGSIRAANTEQRTARRAAIWNVSVCAVLLFGIAAGMLLFERPTVSMEENRTLAKMPEWSVEGYLSGAYTSGVAEHYNDTVPFRSTLKGWVQNIRKYMGLSGSAVIHGNMQAIPADTEPPAETTAPALTTAAQTETLAALTTVHTEATTTEAAAPDEPEREGEISNNILIVDKRGIMLFGGWEKMGSNYARIVNRYKETMPDINMYSMVIPTVCSYYTPPEFQHLITSEKANIDYINQSLEGVTPVDVYTALGKHTEETIYMRTDHHWSSLGAFYAAEEFSADARVPFARIEEYERHSKDDYVGTLYGYSNDIILKENPEEFFWYVPKAPFRTTFYSNSYTNPYEADFFMNLDNCAPVSYYMVYMTGDDHIVQLDTEVHNGRRLCVIKDSYGNALIPWLTSSFEQIYVIDMRYFKLNAVDFMRQHAVTDVLFAMNSFSANGGNAQDMETILTQ